MAFLQAVASRNDIQLQTKVMGWATIIGSGVAIIAMHGFGFGSVGVIISNASNMLIRIRFAKNYAELFFKKYTDSSLIPFISTRTFFVFTLSYIITSYSESYFGWISTLQKLQHAFVGIIMAALTFFTM